MTVPATPAVALSDDDQNRLANLPSVKTWTNDQVIHAVDNCDKLSARTKAYYKSILRGMAKTIPGICFSQVVFHGVHEFDRVVMPHIAHLAKTTIANHMNAMLTPIFKERLVRALNEKIYDEWRERMSALRSEGSNERYGANSFKGAYLPLQEIHDRRDKASDEMHMEKLLVGMYTLIPPARLDYNNTRISTREMRVLPTEGNHLILSRRQPQIVLNTFKTSKSYGRIVHDIGPKLLGLIKTSLRMQPRKVLFVNNKGNPFDSIQFAAFVKKCSRAVLNEPIGVNSFRHAYASSLNIANMTNDEHRRVANAMGHSQATSFQKYRVVNTARDPDPDCTP